MATRIELAKTDIIGLLDRHADEGKNLYSLPELGEILNEFRDEWRIAQAISRAKFVEFLLGIHLKKVTFKSEVKRTAVRYLWRSATRYEKALSINPRRAYLSHGSAVAIHGLTDLIPKRLYINIEQSPKPPATSLTQEGINRAFSTKQRVSRAAYKARGVPEIIELNGKNSGNLEVAHEKHREHGWIRYTRLERTLVDIIVRPAYAGGIYEVRDAYAEAADRVSVNTLVATLNKLDHLYPYHQAIGFLLQRSGLNEKRLKRLRNLPRDFDFHLTHRIEDPVFDEEWRLFYPRGF